MRKHPCWHIGNVRHTGWDKQDRLPGKVVTKPIQEREWPGHTFPYASGALHTLGALRDCN